MLDGGPGSDEARGAHDAATGVGPRPAHEETGHRCAGRHALAGRSGQVQLVQGHRAVEYVT